MCETINYNKLIRIFLGKFGWKIVGKIIGNFPKVFWKKSREISENPTENLKKTFQGFHPNILTPPKINQMGEYQMVFLNNKSPK
jgi:hypothetical protein